MAAQAIEAGPDVFSESLEHNDRRRKDLWGLPKHTSQSRHTSRGHLGTDDTVFSQKMRESH